MNYLKRISKAIGGALSAGASAGIAAAQAGGDNRSAWLYAIGFAFAGGVLTYFFPANATE